jgi:tetratricopeptide (TPR) repeat protein
MLFDLQSRGRRTVVKFVYLALAVLIGGGLVLFGVGTGTGGGGLVDIFTDDGSDTSSQVNESEKRADRLVRQNPQDATAWAELARARYLTAGQGDNFNTAEAAFTEQGLVKLDAAAQAWERYLALRPSRFDANVARLMAQAYAPGALDRPADAATALEIVTEEDPSAAAYSQLAQFAYLAGQERKGDLAAAEAVRLAPETQKRTVRLQLERAKRDIVQQQLQEALERGDIGADDGTSVDGAAGRDTPAPRSARRPAGTRTSGG